MKKIDALVRSAIGFDETRGDKLEVLNVQFAQEEAQALTPEDVRGSAVVHARFVSVD